MLGATTLCAPATLVALWRRNFRWSRAAAIGQVALILAGWSLAQYPHLITPDLTLSNSAAPTETLRLLIIALCAGAVLLLPSLVFLFRVFKGSKSE